MQITLAFKEYNKNKHAASWPPALGLSNISLNGTCILPGGAPTHRRWHFNKLVNAYSEREKFFLLQTISSIFGRQLLIHLRVAQQLVEI
jgi:hypothetical protein